jgi:hypothetical protein
VCECLIGKYLTSAWLTYTTAAKVGGVDDAAGIESSVLDCCKGGLTHAASAVEAYSVGKFPGREIFYQYLAYSYNSREG